jgi:hydroxyquinol 1,2-dioxygenase
MDSEQQVTDEVLASFDGASPRLREVLAAVVRHAHAVVRETRVTEEEWAAAVGFLTRCGQISDGKRQEFILLSDVLGLSMLTIAVNHPAEGAVTESTVLGPFFVEGSPEVPPGGDLARGAAGEPCWVTGTVRGLGGEPVAGARIDVWQADEDGSYDVQYGDDRTAGRGHLFTGTDGGYRFWAVTPTPYPIPDDGPVGDLLAATGRSPMRAPHLHLLVTAPGYRRLITHIFVRAGTHEHDGRYADAVFGVKESLLVDFAEHAAGDPAPDGSHPDRPWTSAEFDVVLAAEEPPGGRAAGRPGGSATLAPQD